MRLVIPGDHLVPRALSELAVLDDVRREYKVWITKAEDSETFFDVFSVHVKSIRAALRAINHKIHDMRLSEESLTVQYFVQPPREDQDVAIRFETGKRPAVENPNHRLYYPVHAIGGLAAKFAATLPPSLKTLVALPCSKMQINFGYFNILAKRKTVGDVLSLEEYESALNLYSSRGRGATIQTEYVRDPDVTGTLLTRNNSFSNVEVAENFLSSILNNEEIIQNRAGKVFHHHVRFDVDKQTISADLQDEDAVVKVTSSRCTKAEGHPPLDWIISAPDM